MSACFNLLPASVGIRGWQTLNQDIIQKRARSLLNEVSRTVSFVSSDSFPDTLYSGLRESESVCRVLDSTLRSRAEEVIEEHGVDCMDQAITGLVLSLSPGPLKRLGGMQFTETSAIDVLPPSELELVSAFQKQYSVRSQLTTGARAWTKHAERCSSCYWGSNRGSESEKNERALTVLDSVMKNVAWMNIMRLPAQRNVLLEVRQSAGYGCRWDITEDPATFRGFLEPQMSDGHAKRWRH